RNTLCYTLQYTYTYQFNQNIIAFSLAFMQVYDLLPTTLPTRSRYYTNIAMVSNTACNKALRQFCVLRGSFLPLGFILTLASKPLKTQMRESFRDVILENYGNIAVND
ncbi:MAG: hypothetical protein IKN12_06930, partial [Selenomonadaceae bacterium]|nr:hypothetical protein [Selenomonadaceae bacterium]